MRRPPQFHDTEPCRPAAIDNLSVSVATNCMYSGNVNISNIGKTTAQASWSSSSEVSQFEVLVTTASNPDEATEAPILVNSTNYEISGLDTETEYYVYVRGVCSESSKGVWCSSSFTTLPACLPVEDINITDYGKTSVSLSFTDNDGASQWQVLLTAASDLADATETPVIVDNTNPTITGLTPNTYYNVYVRTDCSGTGQSTWTYGGSFTTMLPCYPVENVIVEGYGKTWVTASWTNTDSDASQWQVLVTTASSAADATEEPILVNATSATVENLEMNTPYYVYVRAYCSETAQSEWVRSSSFKTYPPCVPPTSISAVVNADSVHFTWTHDYNLSTFHLYLSDTEMSESELNALTSSEYETETYLSHNYTGLTEGHTYHFYIRDICIEGDLSDWAHFPFTTPTDEVMPLPYYQDFEDDIVENWHLSNGKNGWYLGTAPSVNGDKSLYISGPTKGAQWAA